MARDDDPEARIRELERAMCEQARASELTAPGYQWPPATTPAGRYSMPSSRPPSVRAARRILFGAIGVAVFAAPVAVAIMFFAGNFSAIKHSLPGAPGGAVHPSTAAIPAAPPSKTDPQTGRSVVVNGTPVPAGPGLVELPTQSEDPGVPIQIAGVRGSRSVACDDRPVSVSGVSNNVIITGHCTTISVSGFDNTVTVDSADQIVTSGLQNRVTYHSGTPEIPDPGGSNTVERG